MLEYLRYGIVSCLYRAFTFCSRDTLLRPGAGALARADRRPCLVWLAPVDARVFARNLADSAAAQRQRGLRFVLRMRVPEKYIVMNAHETVGPSVSVP